MISYHVYKILHFAGLFMIFVPLGALLMHAINGGTRQHRWRRPAAITHGMGMLLTLVAGFGLLARIGGEFQAWVMAKLAIWLFAGLMIGIVYRKPEWSKFMWWLLFALPVLGAYLALYKPS